MYPVNFIGRHLPLDSQDRVDEAARLQIRVALIHAFSDIESNGSGFLSTGEPKILFESHEFHLLTSGKYDRIAPNVSTSSWMRNYGAGDIYQYHRLRTAMNFDEDAALSSCSWGRYQQMGYQFSKFGFASIADFVEYMCDDEANHLHIFGQYCRLAGMLPHLRSNPPDYAKCALLYNGPGYRVNGYHTKLQAADAKYCAAGEDYIPTMPK